MGLLDDAIREHLDLKRRRGADPDEIARAEHDALGPVRREPVAAEPAEELPHTRAEAADAEVDAAVADVDRAPQEKPPAAAPEAQTPPAEDPRHSDIVHQPTTEFRVEDHHDDEDEPARPAPAAERGEESAADKDVLEETPEFLEETPEHDRLWFEQRPPRDFDFDG